MTSEKGSFECLGHNDSVTQLSYSRLCGSRYFLASASLDELAILRQGDTGQWLASFTGHEDGLTGVSLSGDATILATSSYDNTARIWDAGSGTQVKRFPHPGHVTCVHLNTDSTHLATGCRGPDQYVTVFNVEGSDKTPLETFQGHTRGVRNVIFCQNNSALLTSAYDRTIRMWDRRSGQQTNSIVLPHHAKSLELHQDGKTVTISYGTTMVFLDVVNFEVLEHRKMDFKVAGATMDPLKESYLCASNTGRIFKYEYGTSELIDIYTQEGVCCLAYSPDGEMWASSSTTGKITIWQQGYRSLEWEDMVES